MSDVTLMMLHSWNSRSAVAKGHALLFESVPFAEPLAVIGSPVLSLHLRSARDQDGVVKFVIVCFSRGNQWKMMENGSQWGEFKMTPSSIQDWDPQIENKMVDNNCL